MRAYRTYFIDAAERVRRMIEIEAADDAVAVSRALALDGETAAVEIWDRSRLVARLGAEFQLEPAA